MTLSALDVDYLARVAALRVRARDVGESALSGQHASRYRGTSVVFAEHREYRPGDDPRTLDVRAYARTDRPVVRRFEHEAELRAALLVDASGSMAYRSRPELPTKHAHAVDLLAGLAYLLLRQGDRVAAARFDATVRELVEPRAQLAHLERVLGCLVAEAREGLGTGLPASLEAAAATYGRRAWIVVATDALANESVGGTLRALAARGHRVTLLHVLDPAEIEWPFRGPHEFVGLEDEAPILADATEIETSYRAALEAFLEQLRADCAASGARYVLARTDERPELVLARVLEEPLGF